MIIKVLINYFIMLGLYIFFPILGWIYIILSFMYLLKKDRKSIKYYIFSLIFFLFSLYLLINPINDGNVHNGIVFKTSENYFIFFSNGNLFYVYDKNTLKEVGDILTIEGEIQKLSFNSYEGEFDFKKYLNSINVFYEIDSNGIETIFTFPIRINEIKRFFISFYDEEVKEFLKMFIYSDSSIYANEVSKIGIYSILSSSGLLVYSLIDILKAVIFRFVSFKKRIYIPYILIIPLLFLTDFKIGVIRALLISINNDLLDKKFSRNFIYTITLFISILLNPYYFKTSSFIYSFLLPYSIYYLKASTKSFKYIYRDIVYILLIQLLFIPISIYFNNKYSLISLIIMLLFKGMFGFIYSLIYFLLLIPLLSNITNYVCKFMIFIIDLLDKISFTLYFDDISIVLIIILYVIFIIMLLFFEKRELKKGYISFIVMSSIILFSSSSINTYFLSYVSFINVGQGDSILIHDKFNDILIDTGGNFNKDIANDILIPYFNKKGIKDLDYVFLSHDDYDHNGAFESLCSNFLVKKYFLGSSFSSIEVGDLKFTNLNHYGDNSLSNDDSSVIKLEFYGTSYLFTGDISIDIENKLIKYEDISSDILKIAHHGSKTSSSYNFLKKVNPKIAVISVGKNNYYNHPSDIVLKRLNSLNIKTYRTDIDGTITFDKYIKNNI